MLCYRYCSIYIDTFINTPSFPMEMREKRYRTLEELYKDYPSIVIAIEEITGRQIVTKK